MKDYANLKKQLLSDPTVQVEYAALEPEYRLIQTLIDWRIKRNLSQSDLAKKVGTKQSAISRLESGESNPSLHFLQKVAKALDAELEFRLR